MNGKPFNEWPTDIGVSCMRVITVPLTNLFPHKFEANHEECEPVELRVTGQIPSYVASVYDLSARI